MSIFYARLVELAFGAPTTGPSVAILVEQPGEGGTAGPASGSFTLPGTCIPPGYEIVTLPAGDGYPNALQEALTRTKPTRLLLFPPYMHHRSLPDHLRQQYPRLNHEEIALQVATESLPAKSLVASLMPSGFFQGQSSRSVRSRLFARWPPKVLITHDHSLQQLGLPVHPAFRMSTVVLEVEAANRGLRFFKCSNVEQIDEDVLADFARLQRQGGGQTRHGYVVREGLPPDAPLTHDLYDPAFVSKQQSIAAIGQVRRVADVADFRRSLHLTSNASLLRSVESGEGVPVLGEGTSAPEARSSSRTSVIGPWCPRIWPCRRAISAFASSMGRGNGFAWRK